MKGPQMAFGSTQNSKVIGVFCLNTSPTSSPTLEHLEVCSSSMKSNIPIPLMKQNPNSTRQKTTSNLCKLSMKFKSEKNGAVVPSGFLQGGCKKDTELLTMKILASAKNLF